MSDLDLRAALRDARQRTLGYVGDLHDDQLHVPMLATVNPVLWELGHVGYFAEFWTLRSLAGRTPIRADADALYDSARIAHDDRWALPLPDRSATLAYLDEQLLRTLAGLSKDPTAASRYLHRLALHHEDMHGEAMLYTRHGLSYAPPVFAAREKPRGERTGAYVQIPGGRYRIGSRPNDAFVFDNEKWEHEIELGTFRIAREPVTNEEFRRFVDAGGYANDAYWSDEGRAWRTEAQALHPLHWRRNGDEWERRSFDRWAPLAADEPVVNVNYFESQAYAAFAGKRLPTEAEWEVAATGGAHRDYPWGDAAPSPEHGNLDGWYGEVTEVGAFPAGESPFGLRDMLGNVWEWTASTFGPYPGFAPDPYREYSEPWFGDHQVLRGGAWSTRARMITTRWRNFYRPQRRDIFTGFRLCD
ncbi:MAG TPA: selenoneine synthase SenA [Candidatus Aquilonibacter sp.]|nr:selenoneine synthase SenA [Candidatus Aquilonibacter sp.]